MKKTVLFGAIALLGLSLTACKDDPDYSHVTPPEVQAAPNTLSGLVSDMQGKPVSGATVTLGGLTATTNAEGIYLIDDVKAGNYTISAAANGMVSVEEAYSISESSSTQNLIWNATLAKVNTTEVNVTTTGGGEGNVQSEALENNAEGKVDIKVNVPSNTVPQDTKIMVSPIYTESSAAVTKAASNTMLIGATLSCSNPNLTLSQDVNLTFALDSSLASNVETKKYVNGQWVAVESAEVNGNVVIKAREFTSYGIFLTVNVTERVSTEALVFQNDGLWNNLYGGGEMRVENATFDYKVGTEITSNGTNKLRGLLIEHLSRLYGANVKTVQGSYPLNVILPIGTALQIKGAQRKTEITVSARNTSVNGTSYGTTSVQVSTYNREHDGGGSR